MKKTSSYYLYKEKFTALIGKRLMQIFLEGAGCFLSWPIVFQGGSKIMLYLKDSNSHLLTLKLDFNLSVMNHLDEVSTSAINIVRVSNFNFEEFKVALAIRHLFEISAIHLYFFEIEIDEENDVFEYLRAIVFVDQSDQSVAVLRDEEDNSLFIHYNDEQCISVLKKEANRIEVLSI